MLITNENLYRHGKRQQLVVLIHGYDQTGSSLDDLRNTVEKALPDADIMVPEFETSISNTSALDLANALNESIEDAYERRPANYREVILVGHSMGALLARKAFVLGQGETEEISSSDFKQAPKHWTSRASRIVLMAGMNRGWGVETEAGKLKWYRALVVRGSTLAARTLGISQLILSLQRGSPFVSDLSIQWLALIHQHKQMPVVVQLLGDTDDLVFGIDNLDLYAGRDFFYERVRNSGHVDILNFREPGPGDGRRKAFLVALSAPVEKLRADNALSSGLPPPDHDVKKVIFVMHGIRDFANWTSKAADALYEEARRQKLSIKVVTAGYGYFSMAGFLLWQERQRNVRWFVDKYTEEKARYPDAQIEYLGHSNGTYLLASALQNYQSCVVDRVIFAGSVARRDFPWDQLLSKGRVKAVRNYVATADWVVGFFPHFFELLNHGDIGGAGLFGFTDDQAHQSEIRYVPGEHGAALDPRYMPEMATFLVDQDNPVYVQRNLSLIQNGTIVLISKICWLVWLSITGVLSLIGYLLVFRWKSAPIAPLYRLVLYIILVFLLLNTV